MEYYTIESSITEAKDLYLHILSDDDNDNGRKYKAEKCPILNTTAFHIPRTDIHSLIVKVHFISNGVMTLDPKFGTGSDDEHNFYNQINFKKIIKRENDEKHENKKLITSMCSTASSSLEFKALKSISSSDLHKLTYGLSKYNKKFQSMAYLNIQVKPILKQRPAKRVASNRKIAFGVVDYSY